MQIGSVGGIGTTAYGMGWPMSSGAGGAVDASKAAGSIEGVKETGAAGKVNPAECQTCKERKYVDGSDENVSFKSATHIAPEAAAGRVRAHEGEHVANAYTKAAQKDGQVINASVAIHTAVCPECGRTYVSGGTTTSTIRYNESNPYGKNQKALDRAKLLGGKMDFSI